MKKFLLLFVAAVFCAINGVCEEVPDGWEKMYMMSGQYEYCSTQLDTPKATVDISVNKDEVIFTFMPKTDFSGKATMTVGTVIVNGEKSDYMNSWDFKIPAGKQLKEAVAKIVTGTADLEFKSNTGSLITMPFGGTAAKNMGAAVKWIENNPIGY